MDRRRKGVVARYQLPPSDAFYCFHTVNAWETETETETETAETEMTQTAMLETEPVAGARAGAEAGAGAGAAHAAKDKVTCTRRDVCIDLITFEDTSIIHSLSVKNMRHGGVPFPKTKYSRITLAGVPRPSPPPRGACNVRSRRSGGGAGGGGMGGGNGGGTVGGGGGGKDAAEEKQEAGEEEQRTNLDDMPKTVGAATIKTLFDGVHATELPSINAAKHMREHRFVYTIGSDGDGGASFSNCLVKIDLLGGGGGGGGGGGSGGDGGGGAGAPSSPPSASHTTWSEEGCSPGEPVFLAHPDTAAATGAAAGAAAASESEPAPESKSEDHGVVMSMITGIRGESFLLVLDAQAFTEVARGSKG
jgi:hypothetical protein